MSRSCEKRNFYLYDVLMPNNQPTYSIGNEFCNTNMDIHDISISPLSYSPTLSSFACKRQVLTLNTHRSRIICNMIDAGSGA